MGYNFYLFSTDFRVYYLYYNDFRILSSYGLELEFIKNVLPL